MRRPASVSARPAAARGYVLIFVAGILMVVTAIALGISSSTRLDAQLTAREKNQLQTEYLLRGGLDYLLAQFAVTRAAEASGGTLDVKAKEELGLWRPDGGPYAVTLKGGTVLIALEDASLLPDANLLTEAEWGRLLTVLAGGSSKQAQPWLQAVLDARERASLQTAGRGFASLQELLVLPQLPATVRFGSAPGAEDGLVSLLTVGTYLKQLDLNRSPLLLFRALEGVTAEQVAKLGRARQEKALTRLEAERLFGALPPGVVVQDGGGPPAAAATAATAAPAAAGASPGAPAATGGAAQSGASPAPGRPYVLPSVLRVRITPFVASTAPRPGGAGLAYVALLRDRGGGNYHVISQQLAAVAMLPELRQGPPPPPRRTTAER